MTSFSNDYFRDLPPRDRRYDTPVAEQLVFSVFPNGVKAWVHVYPCDDFVRRRTMGLFPEMDYDRALAALDESRRIAEMDASENLLKRPPLADRARGLAMVVLLGILILETAYLVTRPDPEPPPAVRTERATAGETKLPAKPAAASPAASQAASLPSPDDSGTGSINPVPDSPDAASVATGPVANDDSVKEPAGPIALEALSQPEVDSSAAVAPGDGQTSSVSGDKPDETTPGQG